MFNAGSVLSSILKFINYWYFRYLMVTELFMCERWERVTIHIFLFIVFLMQWYFNYCVFLPLSAKIFGIPITLEQNSPILMK
ncbi:unnamed protein product [Diamesa tonsa]